MNRKTLIIILTVITAVIHLGLGISQLGGEGFLPIAFVLNGLGYLGLLAALYWLPQFADQRTLVRYALMAFAAVTFVLYFVFNGFAFNLPGYLTKIVELVLIVFLYMDSQGASM
jgi:hypothetical protein